MSFGDMASADILGRAIISFGYDRHGPTLIVLEVTFVGIDHPANGGMMNHAHRMRVGDADGAKEIAGLINPVKACHLTIAVEIKMTDPDRPGIFTLAARHDGSYTGADRTFAYLQWSVTFNQRGKTHLDTRDVSDGVKRTGRSVKRDTDIPRARLGQVLLHFSCAQA